MYRCGKAHESPPHFASPNLTRSMSYQLRRLSATTSWSITLGKMPSRPAGGTPRARSRVVGGERERVSKKERQALWWNWNRANLSHPGRELFFFLLVRPWAWPPSVHVSVFGGREAGLVTVLCSGDSGCCRRPASGVPGVAGVGWECRRRERGGMQMSLPGSCAEVASFYHWALRVWGRGYVAYAVGFAEGVSPVGGVGGPACR